MHRVQKEMTLPNVLNYVLRLQIWFFAPNAVTKRACILFFFFFLIRGMYALILALGSNSIQELGSFEYTSLSVSLKSSLLSLCVYVKIFSILKIIIIKEVWIQSK